MAAVGRKAATTASHYSSTSAGNLDNNLDALLDDLQTSIKPGASSSYHTSSSSRHVESSPQHSTTRIIETTPGHSSTRIIEKSTSSRTSPRRSTSPLRSISPSQARNVTVEKYVSSGPIGTASGIPGLEMLDKELADVQPGQSKTVAYKQVSYHYDKQQEGSNLEPWVKTEKISKNDASIVDDFCERTFEKSSSSRVARDSPDFAKSGKEIIYKADVSTKTIPVPQPTTTETRSTERDFKYVKETSYRTEPSPVSPRKNIKTVRTDETEELTNVEYIPASTPIPAPGPNTKVTKTVTTYSYQLPPTTTTTKDTEKSLSYHVEEQRSGVREYVPPPSPASSRVHREEKVYVDRRIYRAPSPPPPVTTSTLSRNERYIQQSSSIPVGHDYTDHSVSRNERVVYQTESQPPPVQPSTERTTVKQYEEHYSSRPPHRPYYPTESAHHSSTTVYKYDEQSLLPKPFPVSERPASPPQQTPRRVDELMASFSDSEEHHEFHEKSDKNSKKVIEHHIKKEVEFIPHSAPMVQSRNFAGPPVYYPPGAVEFSKKEESLMGGSKASGAWAKERAAYEYGSSSKSEEKSKTKKAVVPVCLPLCCALPCSIL